MSIYTRAWYWENFADRERLNRGCGHRLSQDDRSRVEAMLAEVQRLAAQEARRGIECAAAPARPSHQFSTQLP